MKEDIDVLVREKANIKELKSAIDYYEDQLKAAKNKASTFEQQVGRLEAKNKELLGEQREMHMKKTILEEKVESLQGQVKALEHAKGSGTG